MRAPRLPDMPDIWAGFWGSGGPTAAGTPFSPGQARLAGMGQSPARTSRLGLGSGNLVCCCKAAAGLLTPPTRRPSLPLTLTLR